MFSTEGPAAPPAGVLTAVPAALSLQWHQEKYAQPGEFSPEDSRRRVARALARAEPWRQQEAWRQRFEHAMNSGLLPAGRIMAGAGAVDMGADTRTLMNCFVLSANPVQQLPWRLARTLQAGGGVGIDFSGMPTGVMAELDRCERTAQAMERSATGTRRRAAQMAVLPARHAEVDTFVTASPHDHPHIARALALDEAFMQAATRSGSCESRLLNTIAHAIWCGGEPSLLFTTTMQADDNLGDQEQLCATNPCGEQPLPPFGACALASVDLTRVVQAAFLPQAHVAWGMLAALVHVGVRLLDNALELTPWPLPEQAREMQRHRRIGLGITGLADTLALLNLRDGSPAAWRFSAGLMRFISHAAYRASVRLARERGRYPGFDAGQVLQAPHFASRLPADLRHDIRRYGLRHSHLLAIAPAASISMAYADGVSSGIEPLMAAQWRRSWRDSQGRAWCAWVQPHALRRWRLQQGPSREPPSGWAWLDTISPEAQLQQVAALAPHVDGGISKTVSMPEHTSPEEIERLIRLAWRLGLKGVALFRRGSRRGVIAIETGPEDGETRGPWPSGRGCETPGRGCP